MKKIVLLLFCLINFLNADSLLSSNFGAKISNYQKTNNGLIFAFDNEPNKFYNATFDSVTTDFKYNPHLCSNESRFSVNTLYKFNNYFVALITSTFKDADHCRNQNVYVVEIYKFTPFIECLENMTFNAELNKCVPKCDEKPDYIWSEENGQCIPNCKENEIWDPKVPGCRQRICLEVGSNQKILDCYCRSVTKNSNSKALSAYYRKNYFSYLLNDTCLIDCSDGSKVTIDGGFSELNGKNYLFDDKGQFLTLEMVCSLKSKDNNTSSAGGAETGGGSNGGENSVIPDENGEPINLDDFVEVDISAISIDPSSPTTDGGASTGGSSTPTTPETKPETPETPTIPETPITPETPSGSHSDPVIIIDADESTQTQNPGETHETTTTPGAETGGSTVTPATGGGAETGGNIFGGDNTTIINGGGGSGEGEGDNYGLVGGDGIGEYGGDYWDGFQNGLNKYDDLIDSVKNLTDYVNGKGIPKLNSYGAVNSCPFSDKFSGSKVSAEFTYDLCKVLSPMRESFYVMFYILTSAVLVVVCIKLLVVLFLGV